MLTYTDKTLSQVLESFSLETLSPPVDLASLAADWGVVSVEIKEISSDAMLLPGAAGYKIALKKATSDGEKARQRFSFAHELGHLLLKQSGFDNGSNSKPMHRARNNRNDEERLCDQIAAEILMPRMAFVADASKAGWSLGSLSSLGRLYGTSIPATASRMINLMPEPSAMGIWKPAAIGRDSHKLQQSFGPQARYGIPNSTRLPRRRLWLIGRADNSPTVETGISPILDRKRPSALPIDVPAEAWAWGRDEFRRVIVFYYPERELTDDMLAVANATWRPF